MTLNLLKRAEVYADSVDDNDRITFEYSRPGQITETRDQQGTVHAFDFDALGRQTQDRVTTLGTGVDNDVRRIASTFKVRGMREKLPPGYDNTTVGSGSVVNEVQFAYNDFGHITHDYQAHGGAVNTSRTLKVQHGYASGSDNTIRPTSITYPNGRVITYDYGSSTDADRIKYGYDHIDRLETMDRGDLDANKDAVSNLQFAQDWRLDSTGNWHGFREDDDGDGSWDSDQQRTANKVNELTDISETTGPSWVTPAYNRAGNMTTIRRRHDHCLATRQDWMNWEKKNCELALCKEVYGAAKKQLRRLHCSHLAPPR